MSEEHLAAARRQQKIATNSLHELESKNSSLQADNKRLSSDVSFLFIRFIDFFFKSQLIRD